MPTKSGMIEPLPSDKVLNQFRYPTADGKVNRENQIGKWMSRLLHLRPTAGNKVINTYKIESTNLQLTCYTYEKSFSGRKPQ